MGEQEGSFWSESGGAVLIMALFVALGMGFAASREAGALGAAPPAAYSGGAMEEDSSEGPRVWLVDGFNLLHAAVLSGRERSGWWRRSAREQVLALVEGLLDREAEIFVVFDGEDPGEPAPEAARRIQQVFAPSADEWLVRRVKDTPRGRAVSVVTADRKLADRARHHGAEVVSPRRFAERCRPAL